MDIKDTSLPTDITELQNIILKNKSISLQLLEEKENIIIKQKDKITYLIAENEKMRLYLNMQLNARFGSRSEKLKDIQMSLFDEAAPEHIDTEAVEAADESINVPSHTRKKPGRKPLPEAFPRSEVIHDLSDAEKICGCGHDLHKIGEDVSEQLDIIPAKVRVIRHRRFKYGCRGCEIGVKVAALPAQPIPKSIATAGLLSHILVSKYVDHLPLYRQEAIFQRMKVDIVRATLSHWVLRCATLLTPLYDELKKIACSSDYVQADETYLQVLNEPNKSNQSTSYLWTYRAVRPPDGNVVIFEYQPSRASKHAEDFLSEFKGRLQTDGYPGYNGLRAREDIEGYGCMAHARRKFADIVKANKKASAAHAALQQIAKLYHVEKQAREEGLDAQARHKLRQEKSKPLLQDFKKWLDATITQVPPQSTIGKAIQYSLNQWVYLEKYADDGLVEIDNNGVENAIRPCALGRRNWLFSGSVAGANASSIIFSLVQTCRENKVEPYSYFKTVLNKITACKKSEDYQRLLPQKISSDELVKAYQ